MKQKQKKKGGKDFPSNLLSFLDSTFKKRKAASSSEDLKNQEDDDEMESDTSPPSFTNMPKRQYTRTRSKTKDVGDPSTGDK